MQSPNLRLCRKGAQQCGDALGLSWKLVMGSDLCQGSEHESTEVRAGMRNRQLDSIPPLSRECDQIEVDGSRFVHHHFGTSAKLTLALLKGSNERLWALSRPGKPDRYGVQERRRTWRTIDRLAGPEGGMLKPRSRLARKSSERISHQSRGIPKIRPECHDHQRVGIGIGAHQ